MKNVTLKRLTSLLMAVSMVLSMGVLPVAATEVTDHTCTEFTEEVLTAATCGAAGVKKLTCTTCNAVTEAAIPATGEHTYGDPAVTDATCGAAGTKVFTCSVCGGTSEEAIPATGQHNYENGVCTVCTQNKPCSLALDCDAPQHVEECLSQASCSCTILCSENMSCPVCVAGGECKGGEEEENHDQTPPAVCTSVENCAAATHETTCPEYDWCAALGCGETHHADCPWGPCTKTEGCELVKNHPGDCTGAGLFVAFDPTAHKVKFGEEGFATLADAFAKVNAATGDVTVEIYGKVTLSTSLTGSYNTIKFVGQNADAEIYLEKDGYITATGKTVTFEKLKLSKSPGPFMNNAGFMNVAFGIYDVVAVNYNACHFVNGSYASSGTVTYTECTFKRSHDKYGLWAYGNVKCIVDRCTFDDYRGIKMYAEGAAKTVDLTVTNSNFSALGGDKSKPAIVLSYGKSVTLSGNTYSDTGVFELDHEKDPDGTVVTADIKDIACRNDNLADCGVLVDGKIYTTLASAEDAIQPYSTVTLMYNETATVALPYGVTLDKNGYEAANVTVSDQYSQEALAIDLAAGGTVKLKGDVTVTQTLTISKDTTLDLNSKTIKNSVAEGSLFKLEEDLTIQGTGTVDSAGDKLTQDKDKLTLLAGTYTDNVSTLLTPGYVQDEDGTVSKTTVSTGKPTVSVSSDVDDTTKSKIENNTAVSNVNTGLDKVISSSDTQKAAELLPEGTEGNTTIQTTVSVTLGEVLLAENSSNVSAMKFDVKPMVQAVNEDGNVVGSAAIPNDMIAGKTIKFRLPIVGADAGNYVSVIHDVSPIGMYQVQGNEDNLYIEIETNSFSTFVVTILSENAKPIAEVTIEEENKKFSTIEEAIAYLGTNSGKLKLLDDISTGFNLAVAENQKVEVDLNGNTYSYNGTADAFENSGTLTLTDSASTKGKFSYTNTAASGTWEFVWNKAGTLNITNCVIEANNLAIANGDRNHSGEAIVTNISGATITTTGKTDDIFYSILNSGKMTITGSTITADYGVLRNAENANIMTIANSTLTGGKKTDQHSYTLFCAGGTATINSGTFAGNADSICGAYSGSVIINDGTFSGSVAAYNQNSDSTSNNVTIQGGTFNSTKAFSIEAGSFLGDSAKKGKIYIPGMVSGNVNSAQFKTAPAETMIETHFSAVKNSNNMYVIQQDAHITINEEDYYYGETKNGKTYNNLDDVLKTVSEDSTIVLSRDEEITASYDLSGVTIALNGFAITSDDGDTIISKKDEKPVHLIVKNGPSTVKLTLDEDDAVYFDDDKDGKIHVIPAENEYDGDGVNYGDVLVTINGGYPTRYFMCTSDESTMTVGYNAAFQCSKGVSKIDNSTNKNDKKFPYNFSIDNGTPYNNYFKTGSTGVIIAESNGFLDSLEKATITKKGGTEKTLTTNEATFTSGSTVVTLKNSYLKTLSKDEYTVKFYYLDGETVSAKFYVTSTTKPAWTPQTGDTIMAAVAIMAVAAAGLGVLLYLGKKKRSK